MKKKKRNVLILLIVSILIIGIIVIAFIPSVRQTFVGGMTITSISASKPISNDQDIASTDFIVTGVVTGGSESIVGTITPEEFKADSGYETEFPLEIKVNAYDEIADYRIINDVAPIYSWSLIIIPRESLFSNPPPCTTDGLYDEYTTSLTGLLISKRFCIYRKQIGVKGHLENPSIKGESTITLSSRGIPITQKISSDTRTVEFRDSEGLRATATLTGSLVTGDSPSSEAPYVSIFRTGNIWQLGRLEDYQNYGDVYSSTKSSVDIALNRIILSDDGAERVFQEAVDKDNEAVSKLLVPQKIYGTQTITKDSSGNDVVRINLDRKLLNQEIRFLIKASWVGVKIGVSKPDVSNADCDSYDSGEDGYAHFTIKNIGEVLSTFAYTLSDCGFNPQYSSFTNQIQLSAGESKLVDVLINSGSITELKDTCTITVYDVSKPSNKDTASVNCEVKSPKFCNPNEQVLQGLCVLICKDDGKGFDEDITFCCDNTPVFEGDKYICKDGKPKPQPIITNCEGLNFFKNFENCISQASFFDKIKLGITGLVLIIGMILTGLIFKKKKILQEERNKIFRYLAILLIGVILSYLVFTIFWLGVGLTILLMVIYALIPAKVKKFAKRFKE